MATTNHNTESKPYETHEPWKGRQIIDDTQAEYNKTLLAKIANEPLTDADKRLNNDLTEIKFMDPEERDSYIGKRSIEGLVTLAGAENQEALLRAMNTLPEDERKILDELYGISDGDGKSMAEVALKHHMPIFTGVKPIIAKATARLRVASVDALTAGELHTAE